MAKRTRSSGGGEAEFRAAMDTLYSQQAKRMGKRQDDPAVVDAVAAQIQKVAGVFNPQGNRAAQVAARRRAIVQLAKPKQPKPESRDAALKRKVRESRKGKGTGKGTEVTPISADKQALIDRIKQQAADTIKGNTSRSDAVRKAWATRRARGSAGKKR